MVVAYQLPDCCRPLVSSQYTFQELQQVENNVRDLNQWPQGDTVNLGFQRQLV